MAKVEGLEELNRAFAALAFETKVRIGQAVEQSAVEFSNAARAAAPVSDLDPHPGALKGSVHVVKGATALSAKVVADAKDLKGLEYGGHVEHGHRLPSGQHVGAHPFFYPAWRLSKKRAMGRIKRAVNAAAKTAARG